MKLTQNELLYSSFNHSCAGISQLIEYGLKQLLVKDFAGGFLFDLYMLQRVVTEKYDELYEIIAKKYGEKYIEDATKECMRLIEEDAKTSEESQKVN